MGETEVRSRPDRGAALRAQAVSFSFDEVSVLRGVDITVRAGEVVGVVGANGAGKSTLMKIVAGVYGKFGGTVWLEGRELRQWSRRELARFMAVVSQEPQFGFAFSALQVVLMGRHPHVAGSGFESACDIAVGRAMLARCGLAGLEQRTVVELSAGQRQRVILARALAQQPRLLLLDEPTSYLDVGQQVQFCQQIRDLACGEGVAVVAIMHDLNLAAQYCDRLYLLHQGEIIACGAPRDVLTACNLERAFGIPMCLLTHPDEHHLVVTPLARSGGGATPVRVFS